MNASDTRSNIANYLLGGWDLAIFAALFSQGALCAQFVRYMGESKRDSRLLKSFVAGLAVATTLETLQAMAMFWLQNVTLVSDLNAVNWNNHWLFHTTVIATAAIAFYVQMFFCYRLWAISRNVFVVAVTMVLFILAFVFACVAALNARADRSHIPGCAEVQQLDRGASWDRTIWGPCSDGKHRNLFASKHLVAHPSIYPNLQRNFGNVFPRGQTAQMLSALLRLTIQSATPGAVCALINFVAAMQNRTGTWVGPALMLAEISNVLLPKLYAISAMWTLNSRGDLRAVVENGPALHTLNIEAAIVGAYDPDTAQNFLSDSTGTTESQTSTPSGEDEKLQTESLEIWEV
ncbi:hypothetical protein K438DRAFT_1757264 [Mycena galopus ATCC 62051]|nr:hypothetical protein K438DRAFT_1757264 [Mycena galopus ATCC 62051]